MTKILNLFGKDLAPEARAILKTCGTVTDETHDRKKLLSVIKNFDVLLTGMGCVIDREIISAGKNLKIIATPTTGLDHIDLAAAKKSGIEVVSLRGDDAFLQTVTSTAELAFGLILALSRHIVPAVQSAKKGEWRREKFIGHSLAGRTLGIIGVGRLGTMMIRYGNAFGMNVLGCDLTTKSDGTWKKVSMTELLKHSDVVSLHVHLSKDTEHLIDAKALSSMKPNALLINTSRGKIVDEKALIGALQSKKIAGYAADVIDGELLTNGDVTKHPLVRFAAKNTNVLLTPHIGGMTKEARALTDVFLANKISALLTRSAR